MKIYQYENYEEYVKAQTDTNKEKLTWVYARKSTIKDICRDKRDAKFVICHGTRSGAEQQFFKDILKNVEVIGTEISDTATQFPMTVQHDFTQVKEEWIGKADIVYSNSFDHSIDPETTIQVWANQLNDTGKLYLEYSEAQSIGNYNDPLDATNDEVRTLIETHMTLVKILDKGIKHGGVIFVCEKK